MEIEEGRFWSLLAESRQSMSESQGQALRATLSCLEPDEIVAFQDIYYRLRDKADTGSLYGAGSLISGRLLSDSTSAYFRNWLVAQGREAYEMAVVDPDSLAELEIYEDPWDEDVVYAAIDVFESKCSDDFFGKLAPSEFSDPEYDWSIYTPSYLKQYFPRLWAKYGANFSEGT